MHDIGSHHAVLRRMLARGENVDLREVAAAADAAATGMRLGYGPLEDRAVPGFARMALDAESWLVQISLEARQAHGDIARELFLGGSQHCVRCHAGCVPTGS